MSQELIKSFEKQIQDTNEDTIFRLVSIKLAKYNVRTINKKKLMIIIYAQQLNSGELIKIIAFDNVSFYRETTSLRPGIKFGLSRFTKKDEAEIIVQKFTKIAAITDIDAPTFQPKGLGIRD